MVHPLAQPQQKLQLNYKTTITQNHQKIELYGSLDNQGTKEVTLIQMGRRWGDTEEAIPHPHVVDKNWDRCLRSEGSQPHTRHLSPGFQCQEDRST